MTNMRRTKLSFDPVEHLYRYEDQDLPGITGRIGKRLGKVFPPCLLESNTTSRKIEQIGMAREFGSLIHEDVELFIKDGKTPEHPVSAWIVSEWQKLFHTPEYLWASELLVSDYNTVATAIDLVAIKGREAHIADIKTGNFDREYCSWQLGIGKYLLERDGDLEVVGCHVISSKDNFCYQITPKSFSRVFDLLYNSSGS
jgi:hypothetical protein